MPVAPPAFRSRHPRALASRSCCAPPTLLRAADAARQRPRGTRACCCFDARSWCGGCAIRHVDERTIAAREASSS